MAQVSKYKVSDDVYRQILDIFLETFVSLTTKTQVLVFVEEFLTPTEKTMLSKRLAIGLLVAKDYDYQEISSTLKVSTSTIAQFAILYKHGGAYKKVIDNILKQEKIEKFLLGLAEGIASIGASAGSKSGGWKSIKQKIRNEKFKKVL